jgi:hypothetical protein
MNNKSPECWATDPQARGLRVEMASDHSLILPFEHFAYSEYQIANKSETLKLVFATHEVILRGQRLRRLEAAVQRVELSLVTSVPERFRALIAEGQPFIAEIEVTSAASAPASSEANPPTKGGTHNGSNH